MTHDMTEKERTKLLARADELGPSSDTETALFAHWYPTAVKYEWLLSGIAFAWAWLSISLYANWVSLPDLPYVTDRNVLIASIAYNVGWWAYLRPRIERLKADYLAERKAEDGR